MADDIVTRLRERGEWDTHPMGGREWFPDELCEEAADEIERLRTALALAVGELSTHAQYSVYSPEQLMQQFLGEARRD
jgi:hypothetical protein